MNRQEYWNSIYERKAERDVSWFEAVPAASLELLRSAGLGPNTCVIDVGGGESRLVDALVEQQVACLAVLDVSGAALARAKERLGEAASRVTWVEADVTGDWSVRPVDIWHDRAVFHFLTAADDRARYRTHLQQTLKVNGQAIIATFATDGPEKCSGLPVTRYSPEALADELGTGFTLVESTMYRHETPWGSAQSFQYSRFLRVQ